MTMWEFEKLVAAHRLRGSRTIAGCRRVLVDGITAYLAAHEQMMDQSVLSRALAKLRRPLCPHCGQPMQK